ncbi:MAG: DUF1580 domain-containing protein [Planctomycetes bacterium]|nr:DUF1580 domain-containing protein [Planctomycetota bacterium]
MADTQHVLSEILAGDALGLSAAARLFPAHRGTGRASPSTVWRWIKTGTRTSDGRAVKLEAARLGTRWLTSKAAINRYMAALTPTTDTPPTVPPTQTAAQQRRGHKAAMRALDAALGPTFTTH